MAKAKGKRNSRNGSQRGVPGAEPAQEKAAVSADERMRMIEAAAYYRAERRGFAPGGEVEDWLAAEREIDTRLANERLLQRLRRERDELRVRMHLAKLDLRQEWDVLEHRWEQVRARSGGALREARSKGKEVVAVADSVLKEIRDGYKRIRAAL
jgi:hypothetical protein